MLSTKIRPSQLDFGAPNGLQLNSNKSLGGAPFLIRATSQGSQRS